MQHSPGSFFPTAYSTPPSQSAPPPLPPPPLPPRSTRAPSVAAASTTRTAPATGVLLDDPVLDARRTLALLLGPGGADDHTPAQGLLHRLETDVDAVLTRYETAFAQGTPHGDHCGADISTMLSTLDALVALLSRSSVGGFDPSHSLAAPGGRPLAQTDVDRASANVQSLFKELQRSREGAELAKAGLSG
ncbi:hypothetical protein JCM1840_006839 [Sporobolomyces johnsonii]